MKFNNRTEILKRLHKVITSIITAALFLFNTVLSGVGLCSTNLTQSGLRALAAAESNRLARLPAGEVLRINVGTLRIHLQHLVDLVSTTNPSVSSDQKIDAGAELHSTLKLIAAVLENNPVILTQSGPMKGDAIERTMGRLDELQSRGFDFNLAQTFINQVGRQQDYDPLLGNLHIIAVRTTQLNDSRGVPQPASNTAAAGMPNILQINPGLLQNHIRTLHEQDPAMFARTLKLIAAWLNRDRGPAILAQRGLSSADAQNAVERLEEFTANGLDYSGMLQMLERSGRTDYRPVLDGLYNIALQTTQVSSRVTTPAKIDLFQLRDYLANLARESDEQTNPDQTSREVAFTLFHRVLKLISADVAENENPLLQSGPIEDTTDAVTQIGPFCQKEFDAERLRRLVERAAKIRADRRGRTESEKAELRKVITDTYNPIIQQLERLAVAGNATQVKAGAARADLYEATQGVVAAPAVAANGIPGQGMVERSPNGPNILQLDRQQLLNNLIALQNQASNTALTPDARNEAARNLHRAFRLIGADLENNLDILRERGPLSDAAADRISARLGEFAAKGLDYNGLHKAIREVGREDDFMPALNILRNAALASAQAARPEAVAQGADREGVLGIGLTEGEARARVAQLEQFRNRVENNQLPQVAMFGDQHGQNAVLARMIAAVKAGQVDEVIGHGDAFDRGDQNAENLAALKELKALLGDKAVFCFGNHDIFLIQGLILNDEEAQMMWLGNGGAALFQEFQQKGMDPKQLALWILKNFKLFHVDERGFLHLHGGIPVDKEGNPLVSMEQLQAWQRELEDIQQNAISEDSQGLLHFNGNFAPRLAALFNAAAAHDQFLWVRINNWLGNIREADNVGVEISQADKDKLFKFMREMLRQQGVPEGQIERNVEGNWQALCQQGGEQLKQMLGIEFKIAALRVNERKLDRLCAKLGVNGIVFGHDGHAVNFQMLNVNDRVFCLDMHAGDNGFMVFNGSGIRFNALANSQERLEVSQPRLLANIDEQIIRLKQGLGEDVVAEEATMTAHASQAPVEEAKVMKQLAARQQGPRYSKDTMRQFKQGLRVIWGGGAFEFLVRESTQQPGALRVQNIKANSQDVAAVVYRENGNLIPGDSLLIEENSDLLIGRDNVAGTYSFVVGKKVFDLGQVQIQGQNAIVLVERAVSTEGMGLQLSRRFINTADEVSVEFGPGAESQTEIQPVLIITSQQDLLELLGTIVRLSEITPQAGMAPQGLAKATVSPEDEERRLVVATVLAIDNQYFAATAVLNGTMPIETGIAMAKYDNFGQCLGIYRAWRSPELVDAFRNKRDTIARHVDRQVHEKYFGNDAKSVMNRLKTKEARGMLDQLAVVEMKPMAFSTPAPQYGNLRNRQEILSNI